MPYIKQYRRDAIDGYLKGLRVAMPNADLAPQDCGELNYAMTMVCLRHDRVKFGSLDRILDQIAFNYLHDQPLRYQRINDLVGAAQCAAFELERRSNGSRKFEIVTLHFVARKHYSETAVAYEKTKIAENGDIAEYGDAK